MASSWVLILTPNVTNGWPAVIGGYGSKAEATAAGREAIMADIADVAANLEPWAPEVKAIAPLGHPFWKRSWIEFTVIPGAASSGPEANHGD
jgi:hypothetical protein